MYLQENVRKDTEVDIYFQGNPILKLRTFEFTG